MDKYYPLVQFLEPQDIADIVWAAEGVKPSSEIQLGSMREGDIDCLIETVNDYGLFMSYRVAKCFENSIKVLSVTRTPRLLPYLEALDDDICPRQERWRRFGELFGYPRTAVEGFAFGQHIEELHVLRGVLTPEELAVFKETRPFRLSQKHWPEEALILKEWLAVLKNAAPQVYICAMMWRQDSRCA